MKDASIRLILQPMTRPAATRLYLAENGFAIDEERLCLAAGRIYSCIAAHYTATPYTLTPARAAVGSPTLDTPDARALFASLLSRRIAAEEEKLIGLRRGGEPTEEAEALLTGLLQIQQEAR